MSPYSHVCSVVDIVSYVPGADEAGDLVGEEVVGVVVGEEEGFVTMTLKLHDTVLHKSEATQNTSVSPSGNTEPEAGMELETAALLSVVVWENTATALEKPVGAMTWTSAHVTTGATAQSDGLHPSRYASTAMSAAVTSRSPMQTSSTQFSWATVSSRSQPAANGEEANAAAQISMAA